MPKKSQKRRSKRRREHAKARPQGLQFVAHTSPFAGMTREEAAAVLRDVGERQSETFDEALRRVHELVGEVDPAQALGAIAYYFLAAPEGVDRETARPDPFLEHHAEVLQALCLASPGPADSLPIQPDTLRELVDALRDLSLAFNMRRLQDIPEDADQAARMRMMTIEMIRGQTQIVRNWGYPAQMRQIVEDLFDPFGDELRTRVGVDVHSIAEAFWSLIAIGEVRLNDLRKRTRPIVLERDGAKAIDKFVRTFAANDEEMRTAVSEAAESTGVPPEAIGLWLEGYIRVETPAIYTFTKDELDEALGADCQRLMSAISLARGDLAAENPEHFFMNNPIWQRPFIRLDDETYFVPVLALLVSFFREIMEALIEDDPDLIGRYEAHRAAYLENEITRVMTEAFEGAQIFAGSKFVGVDGRDGENDLLVLIDHYAVVIEAKSGAVHPTARRGAELRLERTISDLLVEPSTQSARFVDYLQASPGTHDLPSSKGGRNVFDTSKLKRFVRLTVTLDELSGIQSHAPHLREAGFLPDDLSFAPTMTLVDLLVITEVLTTSAEKIHYLTRRGSFEEHAEYLGDESDLLAFYLDNGFNIGDAEFDGTTLHLLGLSKRLDPYFLGISTKKPQRNLSKYWRDLIHSIEARRFDGWCETALILLNVARGDQSDFERGFKRVQQNVLRAPTDPSTESEIHLLNGPPQRRDAIVGIAVGLISRDERDERMRNAAGEAMNESGAYSALVLGVQAVRGVKQYPYGVAAVFYDPENF